MARAHPHMDEDQILRAVVDEADLPQAQREHLATCARCRGEKERFEGMVEGLAQKAARMTPPPAAARWVPPSRAGASFRHATVSAAAAVLVLLVWWGLGTRAPDMDTAAGPNAAHAVFEEWIREINRMAENPLPSWYLDLVGETVPPEPGGFIQFLAPALDAETVYPNMTWKGARTCTRPQAPPLC